MAVVKGGRRQSTTERRARAAARAVAKAAAKTKQVTTERLCRQCDPPVWVRAGDVENHRSNWHRKGGYQYELRKQREQAAKDAEKTAKAAEKAAASAPARPADRPRNPSKTTKGKPVAQGGTNGSTWTSPVARNGASGGGNAGPAAITTTEAIVQLFWTWARQVPPSIPASQADADAAAEMWRQAADAMRARARLEAEQNKLPPDCVEPLEQAAQLVSRIGDQHMEVVKRVKTKYGEVARTLADPRTPSAEFLKGGA